MVTPFGERMPFGGLPAPEVFQEKLNPVIEGLDRVFAVFDVIVVIGEGETLEEAEGVHDTRFLELIEWSRDKEFRLHPDK